LFWARWDQIEEQHADDPRALLEALLSESRSGSDARLSRLSVLQSGDEFPDKNHPPGRRPGNKEELRARLATIFAKLGAGDPNRTASQIALIINARTSPPAGRTG